MHPWHHLYWFLFGSYHGVVLVLVMLVMTRPNSPKTDFVCIFSCVFGFGDFAGPSGRKVSLFHLLAKHPLIGFNISSFFWVALVVLFPTKLDLPRSEFPSKSYSVSGFCCFSLCSGSTAASGGSTAGGTASSAASTAASSAAREALCEPSAAVPPPLAAVQLLGSRASILIVSS